MKIKRTNNHYRDSICDECGEEIYTLREEFIRLKTKQGMVLDFHEKCFPKLPKALKKFKLKEE